MTITKDFYLNGSKWDEGAADAVDGFCQDVVDEQVEHRGGTYTGNGGVQVIRFERCLRTPGILFLTNTTTGSVSTVTMPIASGDITSWTKDTFTLRAASAFNTAGTAYAFFLISQA
jgi:hypothetical protein